MMKSIKSNIILLVGLQIVSVTARAEQLTFLDIARDASGEVMYMKRSDAVQYCANLEAHLPSARELAQLSMSLGAKGIVDTCHSVQDCYEIGSIQNTDGSEDKFYFSFSGYQRPAGELGNNWFWSSSVTRFNPYIAFVLDGRPGYIETADGINYRLAVRCVVGP